MVQSSDYDTSLPSTPLLYAFVETGHAAPRGIRGWSVSHHPGPASANSGGISIIHHTNCPVAILPTYTATIDPFPVPNTPSASAVVSAIVRPRHCSPFLLVVVYLPPDRAKDALYISQILDLIEQASTAHASLPLLIVGDFNLHHDDWLCPMALLSPSTSISAAARHLASWIDNSGLDLANPQAWPPEKSSPPTLSYLPSAPSSTSSSPLLSSCQQSASDTAASSSLTTSPSPSTSP